MIALMVKWINSFVNFYSSNGTMDAYQIGDTISLIREEYPHYTPMDFKLFFKIIKRSCLYMRGDCDEPIMISVPGHFCKAFCDERVVNA